MSFAIIDKDTREITEIAENIDHDLYDITALQTRILIISELLEGHAITIPERDDVRKVLNFFHPLIRIRLAIDLHGITDDIRLCFGTELAEDLSRNLSPSSPPPP